MKENQPPTFVCKLPARNRPSYALKRVIMRYMLIFVMFALAGILFGTALNERLYSLLTNVLVKFTLSTVTQNAVGPSKRFAEIFGFALPWLVSVTAIFVAGFTPVTGLINSVVIAAGGFLDGISGFLVFRGSKDQLLGIDEAPALILLIIISLCIILYFIKVAADSEIFAERSEKCRRCGEKLLFRSYILRYVLSFPMSVGITWLAGLGGYFIILLVL